MLKSHWTIAWRTLVRNKIYTLVNVAGLSLGICACLVIWVIVHYEFSFDRDHPDGNRVYRINSYEQFMKNEPEHLTPMVMVGLPEAVRKEIPGVETVAPYYFLRQATARVTGTDKRKTDYPDTPIVAGPEYFLIMRYDWLAGDAGTALAHPFGVVLTESKVRQYFGAGPLDEFIGREVVYNDSLRVNVTGIVRDWAGHTDFPFTEFISLSTAEHSFLRQSLGLDPDRVGKSLSMASVLLKLQFRTDPDKVNASLTVMFNRNWRNRIIPRIELQPLGAVHFTASGDESTLRTAQLSTLYGLLSIALFILALAIINYVNLATAQSLTREKEISIRKVMGSGRGSLMLQLIMETFLLTALAAAVAALFVRPVLGAFRQFIPAGVQFDIFSPSTGLFLLGITIVTSLLAGLYPARLLSAHSPMETLKGAGAPRGSGKWWLRKGLIIFQFTISLFFIIGTIVIGRQIGYMLHKDLGFRSDAIVLFDTDERRDSVSKVRVLQEAIRQLPGISEVARENMPPAGRDMGMFGIQYFPKSDDKIPVEAIYADEHFIPLYGIQLLAGRNIFASDTIREVVINETLSALLGFRSPAEAVGHEIFTFNKYVPIVGVMRDFHKSSYHEAIQPLVITDRACTDIAVRLDTKGKSAGEVHAILNRIERQWKQVYPHRPFNFGFFDEQMAEMYRREQTMEWLMNIATGITIFISCIGLFGLTLFTTRRRTKEIGIRKVLGARVTDILTLLGGDFVRLVGIALVIASAGGWYFMHLWLQDYVYRVRLGPDIFLLAGGALLAITVLTVGVQSLRAALVNPVESLRTE